MESAFLFHFLGNITSYIRDVFDRTCEPKNPLLRKELVRKGKEHEKETGIRLAS